MVLEVTARAWLAQAQRDWAEERAALLAEEATGIDEAGADQADTGSVLVEREIDAGLAAEAAHVLNEIAEAWARLDEGRYGRCEACGDAIAYDRLKAIPWARRCVADQVPLERLERA